MTRFHVGGRVIKTALAVTLSIYISQQLGLERVTLAAVVALVTVQRTFYHSLLQSLGKLGSVLLGGVLGTLFAFFLGDTPLTYGLITLASILLCLQLRLQDNIILTTITAIAVIFSAADNLKVYLVFSLMQIAAALLGGIVALTINYLFTPDYKREVVRQLRQVNAGLQRMIDCIIKEMLKPGCDAGEFEAEVLQLKKEIENGKNSALLLQDEQRFIVTRETTSEHYSQAFLIFDYQLDRLEEMHKLAQRMAIEVPQTIPLVKLFRIIRKIQHNRVSGKKRSYAALEQAIQNLERAFNEQELPRTRAEFISRASLFHLFQEINSYYRRTLKLPVNLLQREKEHGHKTIPTL